jgi:hypothetical protein
MRFQAGAWGPAGHVIEIRPMLDALCGNRRGLASAIGYTRKRSGWLNSERSYGESAHGIPRDNTPFQGCYP